MEAGIIRIYAYMNTVKGASTLKGYLCCKTNLCHKAALDV